MMCPCCGKKMEKGSILGEAPADAFVSWLPENEKVTVGMFVRTKKNLLAKNGLALSNGNWGYRKLDTYICRTCRKGIFEF